MTIFYEEYHSDTEAVKGIEEMRNKGIAADDIYVVAQSDQHAGRIAKMGNAHAAKSAAGLGDAVINAFRSGGNKHHRELVKLGFTDAEAELVEEKLEQEKIIVVAVRTPDGFTL
ncbi:general stress protein [Indiicoccus explosivorum]|uniref:general stress protein n=1 Tax=Indiicoccus explosivorum TaxID=1917864 RepID=UPI000B4434BA|nr:general stress protein [Indiicoccus explosivorum]